MAKQPPVSYESLERQTGTPVEIQRAEIGLRLTHAILALIAGVLVLVALFGWLTYPNFEHYGGQRGSEMGTWDGARDKWFADIKDLLQLLVVSLLIPLLTTVIGYIFGRHAATAEQA